MTPLVALVAWIKVGRRGVTAQAQSLALSLRDTRVPPAFQTTQRRLLRLPEREQVAAVQACLDTIRTERRAAVRSAKEGRTRLLDAEALRDYFPHLALAGLRREGELCQIGDALPRFPVMGGRRSSND